MHAHHSCMMFDHNFMMHAYAYCIYVWLLQITCVFLYTPGKEQMTSLHQCSILCFKCQFIESMGYCNNMCQAMVTHKMCMYPQSLSYCADSNPKPFNAIAFAYDWILQHVLSILFFFFCPAISFPLNKQSASPIIYQHSLKHTCLPHNT